MTDAHRRYLLLEQGLGAALVNLVLNAAIAWALFRTLARVPLWGEQSIAGDTFATCFLLPLLTTLIVTRLALREVARGRLPQPSWRRDAHAILGRLPAGSGRRGIVLGGIVMLLVAPVTCAALTLFGIDALGFGSFVVFKAGFAGVLGGLVTPVVAWCALGDA